MRIWLAVRNAVSEANSPTAQGREMNGTMSGSAVASANRAFSLAIFFTMRRETSCAKRQNVQRERDGQIRPVAEHLMNRLRRA